jgi:hypothetical protein
MTRDSSFPTDREPTAARHRGVSVLAICLAVFGLFAVVTGSTDVILGPHLLVANGAARPVFFLRRLLIATQRPPIRPSQV